MNELLEKIVALNGQHYYDIKTFAELTKRSEQAIRLLVNSGNRVRRLEAMKVSHFLLIPKKELTDFPFCCAGRSKLVIRFRPDGTEYTEQIS